jgi:hypothetical protein
MKSFPIRIFLVVHILLISLSAIGQTTYYQQFRGNSNKFEYLIYLNNVHDKLSGNLYFNLLNSEQTANFTRIEFVGNIENDSLITLRKFTEENNFASGVNLNNQLNIIVHLSDSMNDTIFLPMQFSPGEIRFESITTAKTVKLVPRDDSPEATFEMTVLVPGSGSSLLLRDLVLKFLNIYPDSVGNELVSPEVQLSIEQNLFLNDYLGLQSLYDSSGASFNWYRTASTQILYNSPELFCMENTLYAFTGGAHGMENISYGIFSPLTDRQLQFNDIFKPDTQHIISNLITNSVKEMQSISQDSSLPDYLYFVKMIEPNENIYLTPNGLGFYYNSYEIAPYSTGQTNVFFRFADLTGLLNKEFESMIVRTKKD